MLSSAVDTAYAARTQRYWRMHAPAHFGKAGRTTLRKSSRNLATIGRRLVSLLSDRASDCVFGLFRYCTIVVPLECGGGCGQCDCDSFVTDHVSNTEVIQTRIKCGRMQHSADTREIEEYQLIISLAYESIYTT